MLPSNVIRCLDRIVALRKDGTASDEWWAHIWHRGLGELLTADNLHEVLDYLSPDMADSVLRAVEIDQIVTADKECLWPESTPFTVPSDRFDDLRQRAELLLGPVPDRPTSYLCMICRPSFDCDWAIKLEGARANHTLSLRIAQREKAANGIATTGVTNHTADFPMDLSELVLAAWQKMTFRSRYPKIADGAGHDGIAYHFACRSTDHRWMAGRTHSPDSVTAPGKLVELSYILRGYVESSGSKRDEAASAIRITGEWFGRLT